MPQHQAQMIGLILRRLLVVMVTAMALYMAWRAFASHSSPV
jgi:hypothetical protein